MLHVCIQSKKKKKKKKKEVISGMISSNTAIKYHTVFLNKTIFIIFIAKGG